MFRILSILLLGIGVGLLLRKAGIKLAIEKTTRLTIIALLCVFGISIGSNDALLRNIAVYGFQAAVLSALGVVGSIVAVDVLTYFLSNRKGGDK